MILLRHCRIVDVEEGEVREGSLSVEGPRIGALEGRAGAAREIDLQGAYLLPGLISCHTHLSIVFPFRDTRPDESPALTALRCWRRGMDALRAGVTSVRTVGELHRADIALRQMIRAGWVEGPRIFSAGRSISVTGGHGSGFSAVEADGPEEFRKAARRELAAGADHIKIFITGGIAHREERFEEAQMTYGEMEAAVQAARSKDTYVCAHAGAPGPIQTALRAGVRCFEHGYLLDRATARALRREGAFLVPTLCVTRSEAWARAHGFEAWTLEKALGAGPSHLESIRLAVAEGVRLAHGTDIPPGDREEGVSIAAKEAEYLVEAGLSPLQALQAATLNAAQLIRAQDRLGRIRPGYLADLVATTRNPLEDISALRDIFFVMKGGKPLRFEEP